MRVIEWCCALSVAGLLLAGCGGSNGSNSPSGPVTNVTTLAGSGASGLVNGPANVARFNNPVNVELDGAGGIIVADFDNDALRKISAAGIVSTLTSPANTPNFSRPFGLAFTPDGRLFVETDGNDAGARDATTGTIWRIDLTTGVGTVVARNLGRPRGLTALSNTQLVLCDLTQNDVRLLNPDTAAITPLAGQRGVAGYADGTGTAARFDRPYGPAITPEGNILLADQTNNRLRLITPAGVVTTFAGDGTAAFRDGTRLAARFSGPQDVAIDRNGVIYVSDNGNFRIRRISPGGQVTTFAGDGVAGFADGTASRFFGQEGLTVKPDGSVVIVADGDNGSDEPGVNFNRVRQLTVP